MKKTILITISALMLTGFAQARTWTSADGAKTFEGDFISCDGTLVTVKQGLRRMTFKMEVLSEKDQAWAIAEAKKLDDAKENKKAAAEFAESDLGKAFKKLQKLEGDQFIDFELETAPKYFLLYYTGSW